MNEERQYKSPLQAVNKAYFDYPIAEENFKLFCNSMDELFKSIKENGKEEYNKNEVIKFLDKTFYGNSEYRVNTYENDDLAIYIDKHLPTERPVVLFEFKGPGRPGMISHEDFCQRSMCQLILYYLREEERNKNKDIKYLVITDCYQYFVFEKKLFYELFAQNKQFTKRVLDADRSENVDYIYDEIIKPEIPNIAAKLRYTYFDIREFRNLVKKEKFEEAKNCRRLRAIFKLISPIHLLKKSFTADHNKLNSAFYKELLYIMGIEEYVEKGSTHKIRRMEPGKRQDFTLIEQTIDALSDYQDVPADEDKKFDLALGLVLVWINRILFLKLLESQLVVFNFNDDDSVKFLDKEHIPNYNILNDLFRKVLAKPVEEREDDIKIRFPSVPYLNSSLFEFTNNEQKYFAINVLNQGNIKVFPTTVLRDGNKKRYKEMDILHYLFMFLDSYDFGSLKNDNDDSPKTLINASVLGLIFEKINGYKDGAFFTPGYITQYICEQTIKKAVVDKFNTAKGWDCKTYEDLIEYIDFRSVDNRTEANKIINSLKICDPAVGSGHFLVSALNQILAIKSDLRILQDHSDSPRRIQEYDLTVEDDELVVSNADGEIFKYNPSIRDSQRIQETLFEEKKAIIENCLFGVDLNPKSVEICRLRLWIELLKNAYYYRNADNERRLQTLPNIDINIKCGNSLLNNIALAENINSIVKNTNFTVKKYREDVDKYKSTNNKEDKRKLEFSIKAIKSWMSPKLLKDQQKVRTNVDEMIDYLHHDTATRKKMGWRLTTTETKTLLKEKKKELKLLEKRKGIYDLVKDKTPIEWRFEFPEILDEAGRFVGFDVIVGNPPYISLQELKEDSEAYKKMALYAEDGTHESIYKTYDKRGDIYSLFVERGLQLLRPGGRLSYILPNKWTKVMYGSSLRSLFLQKNLVSMVDFCDYQIFSDATTYTCIIELTNEPSKGVIHISQLPQVNKETLAIDIENNRMEYPTNEMDDGIWFVSSLDNFRSIKKMIAEMNSLNNYVEEKKYYGIKTGSKVFYIKDKSKLEEIMSSPNANEIIYPIMLGEGQKAFGTPVVGSHLICMPKGFTKRALGNDDASENEAWQWFSNKYPGVAEWLKQHEAKAKVRSDQGDYWWELRACDYYDKFRLPKIFYQAFQVKPCFVYDETGTLCNNSMFFLSVPDKALLALLCSDTGWWLISEFCPRIRNGYQLIWENFCQIPIPQTLPESLNALAEDLSKATKENDEVTYESKMQELNECVASLYHLQ